MTNETSAGVPVDIASKDSLKRAINAARAGNHEEARRTILRLLGTCPQDALLWFWLACVTTSPWEAITCLQKAHELGHVDRAQMEAATHWLRERIEAGQRIEPMAAPFVPPLQQVRANPFRAFLDRSKVAVWAMGIMATLLIAVTGIGVAWLVASDQPIALSAPLIATPLIDKSVAPATPLVLDITDDSLRRSWEEGDWGGLIAQLEHLDSSHPLSAAWRNRLFDAYVQYGDILVAEGEHEQALRQYDRAATLRPFETLVQGKRGLLRRYLKGVELYQAGDWAGAVSLLQTILPHNSHFAQTQAMLREAHYQLGTTYQTAGLYDMAETEYRLAIQFADDPRDLHLKLQEVQALRATPTPLPPKKRIEVSIAKQRFYAYENDELIYEFICSTGMRSSPTVPGHYQILDKIPNAYASTWDLDMPYWMGIYWSGNLENGIHALPILSNGQVLWEGLLGQPASYGCVILRTEDAKTIYEWAEIGTPVIIY